MRFPMARKYFHLVVGVAAIGFISFFACGQKNETPAPKQSQRDIVCRIVDGDTFIMSSGKTVRILCIDTPETGEKYYDEAKAFLDSLIIGKEVSLQVGKESSDRYGRTLAEIFVDTLNIGRAILKAGLAQLYLFQDNTGLKDKYVQALTYAVENKLGIWSLPPPKVEKYYISIVGSHRFHRPLCLSLKNSNPNRLIKIQTRKEAILDGLSPCRNCHP
jgi:micrococcal nuclease